MPSRTSRRAARGSLALALLLAGAGCSTTKVKVSRVWAEPDLKEDRYEKVMVAVVVPKFGRRQTAEDHIVAALQRDGRTAVRSWDALPEDAIGDRERIAAVVAASGADALMAVRLVDLQTERREHAGAQEWVPVGNDIDYYGYVTTTVSLFRKPDYSELRVFTIETTLWDVATKRMVWACQSDSTTANQTLTTAELSDDYAAAVTKRLRPYLRGK